VGVHGGPGVEINELLGPFLREAEFFEEREGVRDDLGIELPAFGGFEVRILLRRALGGLSRFLTLFKRRLLIVQKRNAVLNGFARGRSAAIQ
jgi:hypothetical protein